MRVLYCVLFYLITIDLSFSQEIRITGTVKDQKGAPVQDVNISIENTNNGTTTDSAGTFEINLSINQNIILIFSHINYLTYTDTLYIENRKEFDLDVILETRDQVLPEVEVQGNRLDNIREKAGVYTINPQSAKTLPTPFDDFSSILFTLPGVSGNNELSSTYSVRGGNFDENLVYVNGIRIYRPQLISSGQQEGLSFVNTDLVESVEFSAGGWQPRLGDKLSSSLSVFYKEPTEFKASGTAGLLGGSVHIEGVSGNGKFAYLAGIRHKNAQYLFNTFDTDGEYLPRFTDFQTFIQQKLDPAGDTRISLLGSYARNRYLVEPVSRETEFGAFGAGSLRLFVAFEGREISEYDTYQGGVKLSHRFNRKLASELMVSGVTSFEREFSDVEGGYRLCDLDTDPGSSSFNECVVTRGVGTNFNFARNMLDVKLIRVENNSTWLLNTNNSVQFGFSYSRETIEDKLNEFEFIDSADFATVTDRISSENNLRSNRISGYIQNSTDFSERSTLTYGLRFNYWDLNGEFLVSPRIQYAYRPDWSKDVIFKAAAGFYRQQPFFRELRDFSGKVNRNIKAQSSVHAIIGMDYNLKIWGRDFKLLTEAYYKYLYNVIPYDIDNVRIRYYGENSAVAYAAGLDFRLSGEFIQGTESWFSLGLLRTREDVDNDGNSYIPRPTDQTLNLAIVFQDHIPNDPSIRVNLGVLYGSGYPFGPPNDLERRNIFNGEEYRRIDIGFSKVFNFNSSQFLRSLMIGVEVLNLIGASNTISYLWIEDITNRQFAVPNTLSARFFNVKLSVKI